MYIKTYISLYQFWQPLFFYQRNYCHEIITCAKWKAPQQYKYKTLKMNQKPNAYEPVHEISNKVVCATSKGSDQPAHMHSLIRAFASRLNIL